MVRRVDAEGRHARLEPADRVLPVGRVIDGRSPARRDKKAKLVERDPVEEGKEDLAQVAVSKRVPDLASGPGRRSERHLASGTPHRGRAGTAWSFHRRISMESVRGR